MAVRRALASFALIAGALAAHSPAGQSPEGQSPKGQSPAGQVPAGQSPAAREPAFVAVGAVPPPVTRIELAGDLRIELEDGELFALSGAGRGMVPRTAPTGRVHAVTRDGTGTVFVGTDAGLFVLDAEHLVLDPADVRDGVPAGALRGVLADGK